MHTNKISSTLYVQNHYKENKVNNVIQILSYISKWTPPIHSHQLMRIQTHNTVPTSRDVTCLPQRGQHNPNPNSFLKQV